MFSRRNFLKTTGAGMIHLISGSVVFGTSIPSHVKTAFENSSAYQALHELPPFDGVFSVDPETLDLFSRDFGLNICYRPKGVLRPGSIKDIQKIIND
jgi:hypothetical protein